MDSRVEYFFESYPNNTHIAEFAKAGYIGLLYGGGAGGCTSYMDTAKDGVTNPAPAKGNEGSVTLVADDDGGYFRDSAIQYYQKGPLNFK